MFESICFIGLCFMVLKTKYTISDEVIYLYSIVVKNMQTGLIVAMTDFADYILYKVPRDISVFTVGENDVYAVCDFLNYLFRTLSVRRIGETTIEMAEDYLDCYAGGGRSADGKIPGRAAVRARRRAISIFLEALAYHGYMDHIFVGDLISRHEYTPRGTDGVRVGYSYKLNVRYRTRPTSEIQQLMRDMPLEIAQRFIDMARVHDPELVFPIVLMLYVGLRGGDVCKIYRGIKGKNQGILTTSISYTGADGTEKHKTDSMEICLLHEYKLRSHDVREGEIKRERIQPVFEHFVDTVMYFYNYHKKLIKEKPCETINGIRPMFLNRNKDSKTGVYMAMTISGLRDRINNLYHQYVLPSCKDDANPNLARYYLQMQQGHTWGKHAFRHYYTVLLLYCGVDDPVFLKIYRGDKSIKSAQTYIRNKGVLLSLYKDVLAHIGEMILPKEVRDDSDRNDKKA